MEPTPERFRRLARSAVYRWRTLTFEGTWGSFIDAVRVHVEQPDQVRVEQLDGALLGEAGADGRSAVAQLTADGGQYSFRPQPLVPELDEDGLVTTQRRPWEQAPPVPFWRDYRFVAVLDPYELSDGVEVLEVRAVEHAGRPAWRRCSARPRSTNHGVRAAPSCEPGKPIWPHGSSRFRRTPTGTRSGSTSPPASA